MSLLPTADLLQDALAMYQRGAIAEATARCAEVLRVDPGNADAHYYLALISCQNGHFAEGAEQARKSIAADPQHSRAHVLLGRALSALGKYDEALASLDRAIALAPDLAQAHGHRADVLSELGRNIEAIDSYDRALAMAPDIVEDWFNRGAALIAANRHAEAVASFDQVIARKPTFSQAHVSRAKALHHLRRYHEAIVSVDEALAIEPNLAEGFLGKGNILSELSRNGEALAAFDRAVALKPGMVEAWLGRGNVFTALNRWSDAFAAYDKAIALKPSSDYAPSLRLYAKLQMCNWTDLKAETAQLLIATRERGVLSAPFAILATPSSAADQLECARNYVQAQPTYPRIWRGEVYSHDRIRIAYLSADFQEHPVAHLAIGLFEQHDKSQFEVTGISFGPDENSPIRHRIKGAFERFIDAQYKSNDEVADLVRRLETDIAVDLMGFTMNNRLDVLARRPAPVQVNYLGYPGTLGADYIDYILADSTIIPEGQRAFYTEQVVWLPETYQINDNRRRISERTPTRGECGLPDAAFVFCCFNNTYKITPDVFDIWMKLLGAIENSVLWLYEGNSAAAANLRREAEKRGVSSQRLIFAQKTNPTDHLARHHQADLLLDTLPYNAHTTASDALWAGLPMVTCIGSTFAGRVAASLLHAIGLDELVTTSLEDYEGLALRLAQDPSLLAAVKAKLARNRDTYPLFDTARFTRNIEAAYTTMWQRHRQGEPPASFAVKASD
jgi:protein O-GlcNAc transferase